MDSNFASESGVPDVEEENGNNPLDCPPTTTYSWRENLGAWLSLENGPIHVQTLDTARPGLWTLPRLIPDVQWLTSEGFNNVRDDQLYIIQVLRGHPGLDHEIAMERALRSRGGPAPLRVPTFIDSWPAHGPIWPAQVRLQSPWLIKLLGELSGQVNWNPDCPRVFFSPFRAFYHYLFDMKACLKTFKERRQAFQETDDIPKTVILDDYDLVEAIPHLETFINFIETEIVPHWKEAASTTKPELRFDEFCMAMQPGELLFVPPHNRDINSATGKFNQHVWRLLSVTLEMRAEVRSPDQRRLIKTEGLLDLLVYSVNWDGTSYVPVRQHFFIQQYPGEKHVYSLPIFPLRFLANTNGTDDLRLGNITEHQLRQQGLAFVQAIETTYLSYEGWTVACPQVPSSMSTKWPSFDSSRFAMLDSQYIQSNVIIDCLEGYKKWFSVIGPESWSQADTTPTPLPARWRDEADEFQQWYLNDVGNRKLEVGFESQLLQLQEEFTQAFLHRNVILAREKGMIPATIPEGTQFKSIVGDDVLLLPGHVVGYALRERRFCLLDVNLLQPHSPPGPIFRDLRIDPMHKAMIQSLVSSHLARQEARKLNPSVNLSQDIIRGKGRSLIFLLHGPPGTGKTATAEAVALMNKRPLFAITCGDLGFTPKEVEQALNEIFRLAQRWNCVLLLDEADVFLSRRELRDLERNGLVTVFLRVLEYYSGILFLTTNRVGTLDDAFKSRIHISLYYPPLNRTQTREIFQVNIRKLRETIAEKHKLQMESKAPDQPDPPKLIVDADSIIRFAERHFDIYEIRKEMRWNGRQIRNAFQIAYSLAEFEMLKANETNGAKNGRLDARHFVRVARSNKKFEHYFYETTEATEADRARKQRVRRDDYDDRAADWLPYDGYEQAMTSYEPRPPPLGPGYGYGRPSSSHDYRREGGPQRTWQSPNLGQARGQDRSHIPPRPTHLSAHQGNRQGSGRNSPVSQQTRPLSPNRTSSTSTGVNGRTGLHQGARLEVSSGRTSGTMARSVSPAGPGGARSPQSRLSLQAQRPSTPSSSDQQRQQPITRQTARLQNLTIQTEKGRTSQDTPRTGVSGRGSRTEESWGGDGMDDQDDKDVDFGDDVYQADVMSPMVVEACDDADLYGEIDEYGDLGCEDDLLGDDLRHDFGDDSGLHGYGEEDGGMKRRYEGNQPTLNRRPPDSRDRDGRAGVC